MSAYHVCAGLYRPVWLGSSASRLNSTCTRAIYPAGRMGSTSQAPDVWEYATLM